MYTGGATRGSEPIDDGTFRVAFRACAAVIFVTSSKGIVLDATEAAASFLNVHLGFLCGKPLLHFVARGDTHRFRAFVEDDGAAPTVSFRLRPRHGAPSEVSMQISRRAGLWFWVVERREPAGHTPSPGDVVATTST